MIKDREYYLRLALDSIPSDVKCSPSIRATNECWADLLIGFILRSVSAPIHTDVLVGALGNPDSVTPLNAIDESWSYRWLGHHGPNQYSSATPFLVRDGAVIGLVESETNT